MDVLVTYDIATDKKSDARRLKKVADLCAEYGTRVQYSVFECRVTPASLAKLRAALEDPNRLEPRHDHPLPVPRLDQRRQDDPRR